MTSDIWLDDSDYVPCPSCACGDHKRCSDNAPAGIYFIGRIPVACHCTDETCTALSGIAAATDEAEAS